MKPFILKQHQKDFAKVRELRSSELERVSGGKEQTVEKLNTVTVTPNGDGGDDGADAG
jgi:hypothetical protein